MSSDLVAVNPGARRAWPWLPCATRQGRIYIGPDGEQLRAGEDGRVEPIVFGGRPWGRSPASDPNHRRGQA